MNFLGAKVVPVTAGQRTLKEAVNEAMRDWVTNVRTTHYPRVSKRGLLGRAISRQHLNDCCRGIGCRYETS